MSEVFRIVEIVHEGGSNIALTTTVTFSGDRGSSRRRRYDLSSEFIMGDVAQPWMFESGKDVAEA